MGKAAPFTKLQKISLALTLCAGYLIGAMLGLPAPFLPKMNEEHGFSSDLTGWMISSYPIAHMAFLPLFAKYNSRLGLYEMTCCGGLLVGCTTILFGMIAYIPIPQSGETDWGYLILVFIMRSLTGIGCGIMNNTCMTMNSLSYPGHTNSVLAYYETAISLGAMTSPVVGSALYKLGGFMSVFVGFGVFGLVITILMFCFLPKTFEVDGKTNAAASLMSMLSRPRLTASVIVEVLGGMAWSALEPVLEPELRNKYGLTPEISALCFVALAGVYGLATPIIGHFLNKQCCIDAMLMMGIGAIIAAVAYLLIGPTPILPHYERPLWLTLGCLGLLGLSCGFINLATLAEIYSDEHGDSNTATNGIKSGLWAGSYNAGALLGPVTSGTLNKELGFALATTYLSGICLLFFLVVITVHCFTKVLSRDCLNRARDMVYRFPPIVSLNRKKDYEVL